MAEVVRLYGLRMWGEQSYKQVKPVLGWSDYQVRSDLAIRRHWQLACLAFSFCWWAYGRLPASPVGTAEQPEDDLPPDSTAGEEDACVLAGSPEGGEGMAGALDDLWRYWRAFSDLPPPAELMALLEWVFSGRGLYLYAR